MKVESKSTLPSISLEFYVVGFFDLLGQQERLRGLTQLPDKSNPDEMAAVRDVLVHTYGAVHGMRTWFRDTFNTYSRKPLPGAESLPVEARALYAKMNSNPIEFKGVSDSMVVFVSLREFEDTKLPARAVLGVITAAALVSMGCLSLGHPIRGGIDLGIGFKTTEGDFYGPALSRAYTLESRVADYPRIVVGDELLRWLSNQISNPTPDIFGEQSKKLAQACWNCLIQDDDGRAFVDYMGPYFRELLAKIQSGGTYVDKAYEQVIAFSERFKKEGNSKLAFRYTLLRNYFEDRMPLWADLPRDPA